VQIIYRIVSYRAMSSGWTVQVAASRRDW